MDIQPGSNVTITVKSPIKAEAAQKTLARIFMKDKAIRDTRLTTPKKVTPTRRAGRIWNLRPQGTCNRPPAVGDSAKVLATVDIIRDIQSVARYVDVKEYPLRWPTTSDTLAVDARPTALLRDGRFAVS